MTDLAGLVELGKTIGVPGLLFGLLYLFMRSDEKKWERQRTDDKEKWTVLVKQQEGMVAQVLAQHKQERDRDFAHLQEQTEYLHGQYATQTAMVTTLAAVQNIALDVKKSVDQLSTQLPTHIRDLHARFDKLIGKEPTK